jgi:hypothetical protein
MLRHVIEGTTTEKGIHEYLILLSVYETCKFRNVDFLDFLRSRMKDIDEFVTGRRSRGARPKASSASAFECLAKPKC